MKYFIKDGYEHREQVCYFVDDVTQDRGIVFQPDVYAMAELLAALTGQHHIIDLGCGRGDKLAMIHDRHPDWEFFGIDHGVNIAWCNANYQWGAWTEVDLERIVMVTSDALIICSDVIEHVMRPEVLLRTIAESGALCVLSTPERDMANGGNHMGPPPNIAHVREWNMTEFRQLLVGHGLRVHWIGLTRSWDQTDECKTLLAVVQGVTS